MNKRKQKTCLVTGVAGFIGSHLAEELIRRGFVVRGIDCFLDNYSAEIKKQNIKKLFLKTNFQFIEGDLLTFDLKKLIKDVAYIFHEAALPGVRESWGERFGVYLDNNVLATQLLLEAVREADLKKFVYASSSSVYGDAEVFPTSEKIIPKPVSPYGATKLAAEHLCWLYFRNLKVPLVSLRYFTVYGPRQRPDMAFHKFVKATLLGKNIEIYGDGNQTRDFTFIDDIVTANMLAMDSDCMGEVFNIGGGSRISVNEVINFISRFTGNKISVVRGERKKGDVRHTGADISKAGRLLGYKPKVSIEKGLSQEISWLKKSIKLSR